MHQFSQLPQLRIVVNSRCGRACFFCRPSGEGLPTQAGMQLSTDDVVQISNAFVRFGGSEIKLTGGDPALWPPLVECVRRLKSEVNVPQLHIISRHPLIGDLASSLATAGADLINVSLDTLDPETHHHITGKKDLPALLEALRRCTESGVTCKVNMVVMAGVNVDEIDAIIEFCESIGVASLKLLDMIGDLEEGTETFAKRLTNPNLTPRSLYQPMAPIVERLRERAVGIRTFNQGNLGHPMLNIKLNSGLDIIVKDHTVGAWYGSVCQSCSKYPCHDALMALRVTADARLQFCLLREDIAVDLRPDLSANNGALDQKIAAALSVYNTAKYQVNVIPLST